MGELLKIKAKVTIPKYNMENLDWYFFAGSGRGESLKDILGSNEKMYMQTGF